MTWTDKNIRERTAEAHQEIRRARDRVEALIDDTELPRRITEQKCRRCFYLRAGRIVVHGFTDWTCAACDGEFSHPNTGVPRLCVRCAVARGLCVDCGGKLDTGTSG